MHLIFHQSKATLVDKTSAWLSRLISSLPVTKLGVQMVINIKWLEVFNFKQWPWPNFIVQMYQGLESKPWSCDTAGHGTIQIGFRVDYRPWLALKVYLSNGVSFQRSLGGSANSEGIELQGHESKLTHCSFGEINWQFTMERLPRPWFTFTLHTWQPAVMIINH